MRFVTRREWLKSSGETVRKDDMKRPAGRSSVK
jgi:hypothetical protein